MVEPDPCAIDDDKLLTTNQAFALSCSFLDHPHQLQHPLSASPPLFRPPYARPWLRITHIVHITHPYRAGQGIGQKGN